MEKPPLTPARSISESAVTINGKNLIHCVTPGQALVYEQNNESGTLYFRAKGTAIQVEFINTVLIKGIEKNYNYSEKFKNPFFNIVIKQHGGGFISLDGMCLIGVESLYLQSDHTMKVASNALQQEDTALSAHSSKLLLCFATPRHLHIETTSLSSLYRIIRITFNKDTRTGPVLFQGHIDLEDNETHDNFIIVGAQKIEILFSERAFENSTL